jgi:two-component system phosphate regulon sensor histidine kinase PhoR
MRRLRWLGILMVVAILAITGFQLYWLQQNYTREQQNLSIRTEVIFRETIMQLQVSKLKLDGLIRNGTDSSRGDIQVITHTKTGDDMQVRVTPKQEIISSINVITNKLRDSISGMPKGKTGMVITMNNTSLNIKRDSVKFHSEGMPPQRGGQIFNLLYGVDSLQDSLRVQEIDSAYAVGLKKEQLSIPFSIKQLDSSAASDRPAFNEVTVGLAKPVTYKLELGNTVPYLLKRIAQPLLFSVLLLGITLLSFVLLYRNLLKQRRLAEQKNEFISNITHELKTPIATVGVAIEALKNFNAIDDPKRTKEYLDISQNELQRLSLLVDKVLKLSMFEKKQMDLKFETIDLREVVDEVVDSLRLQLEKNKASLSVTQEGNTAMQGDRLHLLSVVFNLLDNALKYSATNPVIKVDIQEQGNQLLLTVSDTGIGIEPEYKEKIFEKFFRVPHGDTHNAKGYGLGLSYVAQVVQKHKGKIEVESQPGNGTTFIITLPKGNI